MTRGLPIHYRHPTDNITLTHIHVIRNATVNNDGDVFLDNLKIVGNRCPARYTNAKYSSTFPSSSDQSRANMYNEVFTLSQYWGDSYFHILVETIPRLSPFMNFLKSNPFIKVHIYGLDPKYVLPFYTQFGLSKERFVFGMVRAKVLYLPQTGVCAGALVFNTRLQSMIQRSLLSSKPPEPRHTILLIKRSKNGISNSTIRSLQH